MPISTAQRSLKKTWTRSTSKKGLRAVEKDRIASVFLYLRCGTESRTYETLIKYLLQWVVLAIDAWCRSTSSHSACNNIMTLFTINIYSCLRRHSLLPLTNFNACKMDVNLWHGNVFGLYIISLLFTVGSNVGLEVETLANGNVICTNFSNTMECFEYQWYIFYNYFSIHVHSSITRFSTLWRHEQRWGTLY